MKDLSMVAALGIGLLCLGLPALAQPLGPGPTEPPATGATPGAEQGAPAADEADEADEAAKADETDEADKAAELAAQGQYLSFLGVALGVALIIAGAAYSIARIASAAMEGMARQPEVAGNIQMALIVTAAMIEGITFFALIICLMEIFA